jgi:vitamin B12 transporter
MKRAVFIFPVFMNDCMHVTKTYPYFICSASARVVAFMLCMACMLPAHSQTKDTTVYTSDLTVDIIAAPKIYQTTLQPSKKTQSFDSLTMARSSSRSLSEFLSEQSTVYIKSYGGGNIATTSFRGGNANHTALLWNGLNIQNAMLGQTDLSIVPVLFFDNLSLEYGGGSALWGSGAIGGSIRLDNKLPFNAGTRTKLQMSIGSFDTKKIAASVLLSYKRIASSTRLYYTTSKNDYAYRDTTDKEHPDKRMPHADYTSAGLMQELSFRLTNRQTLNVRAWYTKTDRNLPSYTSLISKRSQYDETLKLNADWNLWYRNLTSTVRIAGFQDKLNYTDSLSSIHSKSTVNTLIAESDNLYHYRKHSFGFGANYTLYQSLLPVKTDPDTFIIHPNPALALVSKDSIIRHEQIKFALFALYKISLFNDRLNYDMALRKEFTNQTEIPFTGNAGIQYQLLQWLGLKVSANKSFRQPTLNDLYWPQGGNIRLKPEESFEIDGGFTLKKTKNRLTFFFEGTYFNRHTTNWIIWLPTASAYFSPRNIAKVYSRGAESRTEISYRGKDLFLKLGLSTAYVLSTNEEASNENDNAIGRQLIYTPRYTGQSALSGTYKNITLLFTQSYTGYRFMSTDNTTWLHPYYIANAKLAYKHAFSNVLVEFFAGINNIFNKNYMAVANRPMPLRNYEAGLALHYHKNNKINP